MGRRELHGLTLQTPGVSVTKGKFCIFFYAKHVLVSRLGGLSDGVRLASRGGVWLPCLCR